MVKIAETLESVLLRSHPSGLLRLRRLGHMLGLDGGSIHHLRQDWSKKDDNGRGGRNAKGV